MLCHSLQRSELWSIVNNNLKKLWFFIHHSLLPIYNPTVQVCDATKLKSITTAGFTKNFYRQQSQHCFVYRNSMQQTVNIFWFRRDLRLHDNAGLYHALRSSERVVPLFVFDRNILDDLEDKKDRRVEFIHSALEEMQQQLLKTGSSLEVYNGYPVDVYKFLLQKYRIEKVFTNNDYEQYAIDRDHAVAGLLKYHGVKFESYKDHVIFEKDEILKEDNTAYTVF